MRITDSLFYLDSTNSYQDSLERLYDVNAQIASGYKIQNSYEDSGIYVDTMRLDDEISTFEQVKDSSSKAQTFANNTDSTMNELEDTLIDFKSKLIQASNSANSTTSLEAIANDLSGMREHLRSISNTSIDGQFLFSGSALDVKPVDADGSYNGNGENLTSLVGSDVQLPYNIDGESLFLGQDSDYEKIVSTNVKMYNQTDGGNTYLKSDDTIQDMVGGDKDENGKTVFYLSGRKSDGSTFNDKFSLDGSSKVSDLLDSIGTSYGNTSSNQVVDVTLNDYGQIEVKDLQKGNSMLQMNIFGAIDRDAAGTEGDANQIDIDDLEDADGVDIIAFDKSNFENADGVTLEDAANYTRKKFEKDGNDILGNVSQVVKGSGEYATASTKLLDVAGVSSLDGLEFELPGVDKNGDSFDAKINFSNGAEGTTFTVNGSTYTVYDAQLDENGDGVPTKADDMTYQQLNDIISMITADSLPVSDDVDDYNDAIGVAKNSVDVTMDYRGRINIHDNTKSVSNIEFSMYDSNADKFDGSSTTSMSFMANDAVTIQEPHIDFFKEIDEMIEAVRDGNFSMDSNYSDPRNIGIENSILKIDHISDHVTKEHTKIGSYSNALQSANQRADLLSVNVQTIRSEIADVDIGEAYTQFTQLSNNYEATLSTIAKINSMSLLNYM